MVNIFFKIFVIIIILLFIVSCDSIGFQKTLDNEILFLVQENCVCSVNRCDCTEKYSSDNVYIDCSNTTITSVIDVIKNCRYGQSIGDDKWEK